MGVPFFAPSGGCLHPAASVCGIMWYFIRLALSMVSTISRIVRCRGARQPLRLDLRFNYARPREEEICGDGPYTVRLCGAVVKA